MGPSIQVSELYESNGNINYPLRYDGDIQLHTGDTLPRGLLVDAQLSVDTTATGTVPTIVAVSYTTTSVTVTVSIAGHGNLALEAPFDNYYTVTDGEPGAVYVSLTFGPHGPLTPGTYTLPTPAQFELRTLTPTQLTSGVTSIEVHTAPEYTNGIVYTTVTSRDAVITPGASMNISNNVQRGRIQCTAQVGSGTYDPCADNYSEVLPLITQSPDGMQPICDVGLLSINGMEPDWGGNLSFVSGRRITVEPVPEHHGIVLSTNQSLGQVTGASTSTAGTYSYIEEAIDYTPRDDLYYPLELLKERDVIAGDGGDPGPVYELLFSYFTNNEITRAIEKLYEYEEYEEAELEFQTMLNDYYS